MSSTNRNSVRQKEDYYVTPIPHVVDFLRAWAQDEPALSAVETILDPCAGGTLASDGKPAVPMSYPEAITQVGAAVFPKLARLLSVDIRSDSPAALPGINYLTWCCSGRAPDLIITNPPFAAAVAITRKALQDVRPGGFVVMLQRVNWFGSNLRRQFWRDYMPLRVYVHSQRMGFQHHLGSSATDSIEYAHFVWQSGVQPAHTLLKVI